MLSIFFYLVNDHSVLVWCCRSYVMWPTQSVILSRIQLMCHYAATAVHLLLQQLCHPPMLLLPLMASLHYLHRADLHMYSVLLLWC